MERVSSSDSMLFNSSLHGDIEGVITALAQGGKVTVRNPDGFTPLLAAAQNGHTDICALLLTHGSNVHDLNHNGFTPLLVAVDNGHTDISELLLAHGSSVNEVTPHKKTALHKAAGHGNNALVEVLLSWGAEVNSQESRDSHGWGEWTPLHIACQEGHMLCVLTLLKAGASLTLPNSEGALPIHLAALHNRLDIVTTLLAHGCSPDMVTYQTQS